MGRLLAPRSKHGWTSAVVKGAPCSLLLCCQQWAWGPFSHELSLSGCCLPWTGCTGRARSARDAAVHSQPRAALSCTSLPMRCLGRELCAEQLLKLKPGMLFCPEGSCLVKAGEADFSCLHEWKHCMQQKHAVYCWICPRNQAISHLLASRLMWWISPFVEHWQVLCLVEEGEWECHLAKACRWALGTLPGAYRLHTHMGNMSLSPCGWWLPWSTVVGCWKPPCWTKRFCAGKEDQICWKHHRLLNLALVE